MAPRKIHKRWPGRPHHLPAKIDDANAPALVRFRVRRGEPAGESWRARRRAAIDAPGASRPSAVKPRHSRLSTLSMLAVRGFHTSTASNTGT